MNNPKTFAADPDYGMTKIARERIRLREDRESKERAEKAKEIINSEFQRELDHRQAQLELIEQRINQAQKTLHLLRYVLISSYYNNEDLLLNQLDDNSTSNDDQQISNKPKIHPAVKKLLGTDNTFSFYTSPRKKIKLENVQLDELQSTKTVELFSNLNTTISQPTTSSEWNITSNINQSNVNEECITGRNRKKFKCRIVIGNISKWMPSESQEDNSTHKWMVYVRGSKENPDISHFVQKVVFYLHPSYKPNDVVELRDGPFHLARRGWGEFPLRVRIFFRCSLNKPVDIIHNLKLDKTFTGRQTLGNETVVDLFLYNKNNPSSSNSNTIEAPCVSQTNIKEELDSQWKIERDIKIENQTTTANNVLPNFEHDYCFATIKQEIKAEMGEEETDLQNSAPTEGEKSPPAYNIFMEHSYCASNNSTRENHYDTIAQASYELQPMDCMFGITEEFPKNEIIEEGVLEEKPPVTKKFWKEDYQKIMLSDGTVVAIKKCRKLQQSLLKTMFHKQMEKKSEQQGLTALHANKFNPTSIKQETLKNNSTINYDRYKINIPSHKFKNVTEALPYLFKRLPIITKLATNLDYKCTYPYIAGSLEEFSSWNIGKRLSSEWYQARMFLKLINAAKLLDCKAWTTKLIIMYGRSHGYTPLAHYKIFKNKNNPEKVFNGTSNGEYSKNVIAKQTTSKFNHVDDIVVDVVNCNPEPQNYSTNTSRKSKLIDPSSQMACSYVKQTALDGGIVLNPEEIIPGVLYNAAERMLLQGVLCLAEELIRRSRANLVREGDFQEDTSIIGIDEIRRALQERPEFKLLLLKSSESDKNY